MRRASKTPEEWEQLLTETFQKLDDGATLYELFPDSTAKLVNYPPDTPLLAAVVYQINKSPSWTERYEAYKVFQAERVGLKVDKLLKDIEDGTQDFRSGRVVLDGLVKRMGQLNRRMYNDKYMNIDVKGKIEHSVADSLTSALERAEKRETKVIEGKARLIEEKKDGDSPFS